MYYLNFFFAVMPQKCNSNSIRYEAGWPWSSSSVPGTREGSWSSSSYGIQSIYWGKLLCFLQGGKCAQHKGVRSKINYSQILNLCTFPIIAGNGGWWAEKGTSERSWVNSVNQDYMSNTDVIRKTIDTCVSDLETRTDDTTLNVKKLFFLMFLQLYW